ncbi:MAG: sigma-54-dependent Fis family transcriptional regulator [Desulfarculus sp.]|nr:sigma-54-dependent Fis family transcriptional regulator [Desulfarculus sp.]
MPERPGILVVDDQKDYAAGLVRLLEARFGGRRVLEAHGGAQALDILARQEVDLMVCDLRMPGMGGLELLAAALGRQPHLSVVMLTAHGTIETAVEALKQGAYDFLTKPIERQELYRVVEKGLERSRLLGENRRLRRLALLSDGQPTLVGGGAAMRRLKEAIAAVAASDYTVLIRGDSGSGKELVARAIHAASRRAEGPFVPVNCPAIPDQLLESELFGHVKGAFTGADQARQGLFQAAQGGTIVLDEIGDIGPAVQTKLLRAVQEQEIRPVGSSHNLKIDARILASTNQDLEAKIKAGAFREDLFYRLNVLVVRVPGLAERAEDIPELAAHFLLLTCREMKLPPKEATPAALSYLASREWPGNVRELLNFVRRLAVFSPGQVVDLDTIRLVESPGLASQGGLPPYKEAKNRFVGEFTRSYVGSLLSSTKGNISEAARVSGLERVSLQKILHRLGLDAGQYRGR